VPPAGLEPAALCLASSIRLSLTARCTSGLLAGLYLGRLSPDPYSLWGSPRKFSSKGFLRITQSSRIFTSKAEAVRSTGGSQGVPAYRVVHSMGSRTFPIKAPTRQMLYPLSYRGVYSMASAC